MNTVSITYYGMDGTGKNVTAAKLDAGHKLEMLVKEVDQGPWFGEIRGYPVCVWRNSHAWTYQILWPESSSGSDRSFQKRYGSSGYATRLEAEQHMRFHLAQMAYTDAEFDDWLAMLSTKEDRSELRRYKRWQDSYKQLRADGKTDVEAHREATAD